MIPKSVGISCACGLAVNLKYKTKDVNGRSTAYVFRCKSCKQDTVVILKFDEGTCENCRHKHIEHHGCRQRCLFQNDDGVLCRCKRYLD